MDHALAMLVPGEYQGRRIDLPSPQLVEIVLNAGYQRRGIFALPGSTLLGRASTYTNMFADEASSARHRAQAESLLTSGSVDAESDDLAALLLRSRLEEASRDLGPQRDSPPLGGPAIDPLDDVRPALERLEAASGVLFFARWLTGHALLDMGLERGVVLEQLLQSFEYTALGTRRPPGQPLDGGQTAAIQIGMLLDDGALRWDPDALAADGEHRGAFTIDFERMAAASQHAMNVVLHILATGDRAAFDALVARYVDGDVVPQAVLAERYRGYPEISFVYSVRL